MKAVDHVVIKGLPTIRENRGEKEKLETCEVRGYDELPKPKAGQKLLTSFSDSGVEYLLSEDPSVDQRIFQTLGFYVPPKDAMEQIFGKITVLCRKRTGERRKALPTPFPFPRR